MLYFCMEELGSAGIFLVHVYRFKRRLLQKGLFVCLSSRVLMHDGCGFDG